MPHAPVLLDETIRALNPQPGDTFIDCTIGGGGHARAILERTAPNGKLLGLDASEKAIQNLKPIAKQYGTRMILAPGNFRNLKQIAYGHAIHTTRSVLLDLGLSSDELADPSRGLSFQIAGPLDMRLGKTAVTAADIVNGSSEVELADIIRQYGEERYAGRIARAIIIARRKERLDTTPWLARVIQEAVPHSYERGRIHPATRTFQALRIVVNDELGALREALPQAVELLERYGRLAVISFHSLEDRIVKRFFREQAGKTLRVLTKKPIMAGKEEVARNPRARSAKLRVAEKI